MDDGGGCSNSSGVCPRDAGYWGGEGKGLGHWDTGLSGGGELGRKRPSQPAGWNQSGMGRVGARNSPISLKLPNTPQRNPSEHRQSWREREREQETEISRDKERELRARCPQRCMLPVMPQAPSTLTPLLAHFTEGTARLREVKRNATRLVVQAKEAKRGDAEPLACQNQSSATQVEKAGLRTLKRQTVKEVKQM